MVENSQLRREAADEQQHKARLQQLLQDAGAGDAALATAAADRLPQGEH